MLEVMELDEVVGINIDASSIQQLVSVYTGGMLMLHADNTKSIMLIIFTLFTHSFNGVLEDVAEGKQFWDILRMLLSRIAGSGFGP